MIALSVLRESREREADPIVRHSPVFAVHTSLLLRRRQPSATVIFTRREESLSVYSPSHPHIRRGEKDSPAINCPYQTKA